jgi:hypothetical protein
MADWAYRSSERPFDWVGGRRVTPDNRIRATTERDDRTVCLR